MRSSKVLVLYDVNFSIYNNSQFELHRRKLPFNSKYCLLQIRLSRSSENIFNSRSATAVFLNKITRSGHGSSLYGFFVTNTLNLCNCPIVSTRCSDFLTTLMSSFCKPKVKHYYCRQFQEEVQGLSSDWFLFFPGIHLYSR